MNNILVLIGISGSGKSTFCRKFIKENPSYSRVNRDDIRRLITGTNKRILSKELEDVVTDIQHEIILSLLNNNKNVIIDNTNLKISYLKDINNKYGHIANIEHRMLIVDISEAKERVSKRDNIKVSELSYIDRQYDTLNNLDIKLIDISTPKANLDLDKCIICDLDGTLALYGNKNPYKRDFENDIINSPVLYILQNSNLPIIFLSGRSSEFENETKEFIKRAIGHRHYELYMRDENDYRRDSILKTELFLNKVNDRYTPLFVIDDRLQVIEETWNKLGIFVLNVNQGNKRF